MSFNLNLGNSTQHRAEIEGLTHKISGVSYSPVKFQVELDRHSDRNDSFSISLVNHTVEALHS